MQPEIYLYATRFFTFWSVLLVLFHPQVFKYVNLLYITFITMIIGLYLSFINPRRFVFYFEGERYEYNGAQKFIIVDILFHILAFYFIWSRYAGYYTCLEITDMKNIYALLIIIIYVVFTNIKKVYGVAFLELFFVFLVANILYLTLFS